ncbi:hypothetical protein SUGI_1090610 [Cryptomeria japonica]|nr:hypothetical protein SUGI_1090610 [Cryptomeria japonica]
MFSYKELRIATENFKHKLGSGALGSVFKGTLPDNMPVPVKRVEGSTQVEKHFRAEIITTGRIQHVNLVRLWGFYVEGSRRLLVYAYMPNGSLNCFLFSQSEDAEKVLDWKTRDFSRILTTTRRSCGYLAPECISGLPVTPKVDVYSFGMTLLEIISGRVEESRLYFPTWASYQIQRGNIKGIVDTRIAGEANIEEVKRAAMMASLCIQDDENQRPSMGKVVKILEGTIEVPVPQIPRSLQVLVGQVDDDYTDSYGEHPSI